MSTPKKRKAVASKTVIEKLDKSQIKNVPAVVDSPEPLDDNPVAAGGSLSGAELEGVVMAPEDLVEGALVNVSLTLRLKRPRFGTRRGDGSGTDLSAILKDAFWRRLLYATRDRVAYSDPEVELVSQTVMSVIKPQEPEA